MFPVSQIPSHRFLLRRRPYSWILITQRDVRPVCRSDLLKHWRCKVGVCDLSNPRFSEGLARECYMSYVSKRFENSASWRQHGEMNINERSLRHSKSANSPTAKGSAFRFSPATVCSGERVSYETYIYLQFKRTRYHTDSWMIKFDLNNHFGLMFNGYIILLLLFVLNN